MASQCVCVPGWAGPSCNASQPLDGASCTAIGAQQGANATSGWYWIAAVNNGSMPVRAWCDLSPGAGCTPAAAPAAPHCATPCAAPAACCWLAHEPLQQRLPRVQRLPGLRRPQVLIRALPGLPKHKHCHRL